MKTMNEEIPPKSESDSKSVVEKIGRRNVLSILMLGTAGQIAWAVENSWFNEFVYKRITNDPTPVAWMVAVSAITATVTTILMRGSTRPSRRQPTRPEVRLAMQPAARLIPR